MVPYGRFRFSDYIKKGDHLVAFIYVTSLNRVFFGISALVIIARFCMCWAATRFLLTHLFRINLTILCHKIKHPFLPQSLF